MEIATTVAAINDKSGKIYMCWGECVSYTFSSNNREKCVANVYFQNQKLQFTTVVDKIIKTPDIFEYIDILLPLKLIILHPGGH